MGGIGELVETNGRYVWEMDKMTIPAFNII
jgi:hypothetical protein